MGAKERGKSIQIDFTYRGKRCRETLKLKPTKANMKHAEGMHAIIMHEIAIGTFDYRKHFPDSKSATLLGSGQSGTQLIEDALPEDLYKEYYKSRFGRDLESTPSE